MVRTCLSDDRLPLSLSYLYQVEKRGLVRRFYLLVVVATCQIQPAVWPVYVDSGLPLEIIREIRTSDIGKYWIIRDCVLEIFILWYMPLSLNQVPFFWFYQIIRWIVNYILYFHIIIKFATLAPPKDPSLRHSTANNLTKVGDNANTKHSQPPVLAVINFSTGRLKWMCLTYTYDPQNELKRVSLKYTQYYS